MPRLSSDFAVLAALLALSASSDAFACACCTDPGERNVTVSKLETAMIEMIEQVEFGKKVDLFTGAGGVESIVGITSPIGELCGEGRVGQGSRSLCA